MGGFFMRRHRQSLWGNSRLSLAVTTMTGIILLLLTALLLSGFALLFISDFRMIRYISLIPLILSSFGCSFIQGKFRRRKGMISGIRSGAILYILISIAGMIFTGSPAQLSKLFILMISGALGGISGVNSKRPKNLRD